MATTKASFFEFTEYNETVNGNGELVITGRLNEQTFSQTTPAPVVPTMLVFNQSTNNFSFVQNMSDFTSEFVMVAIITEVVPD